MYKERIIYPTARSKYLGLINGVGGVTAHSNNECKSHASSMYSILLSGVISLYE